MAASQKRPLCNDGASALALSDERFPKAAKSIMEQEEDFTVNCPVHGLIRLPWIAKAIVDTEIFQRMRHIKQLGLCPYVYPGATHDRFFHSIGTAHLAKQFVDGLRQRQPELGITHRDMLCVMIAGLCHDLGHPCFSHMFERFVHQQGIERRKKAEAAAEAEGRQGLSDSEEAEVRKYEEWNHEAASTRLLSALFEQLRDRLEEAGLRCDAEGDDFACIGELIDPPKKELEKLQEAGKLRTGWSALISGRSVDKAWLYDIVSNWRSGVDVDKFDYFRRDAHSLGIHNEFDHNRYITGVRVVNDGQGVPTVSPPEKEVDRMRDMFELRKMLHRAAYQHKTVKKLEIHVVDVLMKMEDAIRIRGSSGKLLSMCEAAINIDVRAYLKLTDTFVEAKLLDEYEETDHSPLAVASMQYKHHICNRSLMATVGVCNMAAEPAPNPERIKQAILRYYNGICGVIDLEEPSMKADDVHCEIGTFHYGMKLKDPISRIVWHNPKNGKTVTLLDGFHAESRPLLHKLFVFWNPSSPPSDGAVVLERLKAALRKWQEGHHLLTRRTQAVHAAPGSPMPMGKRSQNAETPEKTNRPRTTQHDSISKVEEDNLGASSCSPNSLHESQNFNCEVFQSSQ